MNVIEFTAGKTKNAGAAHPSVQRRQLRTTDHHAHTVGMAMVMQYLLRKQERYKAERSYGIALATARASLTKTS